MREKENQRRERERGARRREREGERGERGERVGGPVVRRREREQDVGSGPQCAGTSRCGGGAAVGSRASLVSPGGVYADSISIIYITYITY